MLARVLARCYNLTMPMTAHDLLDAANSLSQADRSWLAKELQHPPGDGSTEAEIEESWKLEVERRIDELDSGAVVSIPWEDVRSEMLAKLSPAARSRLGG